MLVYWHTPSPLYVPIKKYKGFRYENVNPNEVAFGTGKPYQEYLQLLIRYLKKKQFLLTDYTYKELQDRIPKDTPIPDNKNELFVHVATWGEIWSVAARAQFTWDDDTLSNPQGPDCQGRIPEVYNAKYFNFSGKYKDPVHNYGIIKENLGLMGIDGAPLPPRVTWACCGLDEKSKGCWYGTDYQMIPYDVAPGFGDTIWEEYYKTPNDNTISVKWNKNIQKGTMWIPWEYYEKLDKQITEQKPKMLPLVQKMFREQFDKMNKSSGNHYLDLFEELSQNELDDWNSFVGLILKYNKIQCGSSSLDLLRVSFGQMIWTKEKFEGILLKDGQTREIVFKDLENDDFQSLGTAIDNFIRDVLPNVDDKNDELKDSLLAFKNVITSKNFDTLNADIYLYNMDLENTKNISIKSKALREIFDDNTSQLMDVKQIQTENVAIQLKLDITRKNSEQIRNLTNLLESEYANTNKSLIKKRDALENVNQTLLDEIKQYDSLSASDILALKKIAWKDLISRESEFKDKDVEYQSYITVFNRLKTAVEKFRNDPEFLKQMLLEKFIINRTGYDQKLQELQKATDELNTFLGEPTNELLRQETRRLASETEKNEIINAISRITGITLNKNLLTVKLASHLSGNVKDRLQKIAQNTSIPKDALEKLLKEYSSLLTNVPDTNSLKSDKINEYDQKLQANLLRIEENLTQFLLDQAKQKVLNNVKPLEGIDNNTLQKLLNISKLKKDDLELESSKRLDEAIWLQRLAIENNITLTENVIWIAWQKDSSEIQNALSTMKNLYGKDFKDQFISDDFMNFIHEMVKTRNFPVDLVAKWTYYRSDLIGWRRKIEKAENPYNYLYVPDKDIQEKLWQNWLLFVGALFVYPDIKIQKDVSEEVTEILVNPEKIENTFVKKDVNLEVYKIPIELRKDGLLSLSSYKWKNNSCWIDSVFTALFAIPRMPIETEIRKSTEVNVATLTLVRGTKKENLGSDCNPQMFHNYVMRDIEYLQRDEPPERKVCLSMKTFSNCVEKPATVGKSNEVIDTITNLIQFYDLGVDTISTELGSNIIFSHTDNPLDNIPGYVLFSCILQRPDHFVSVVREPAQSNKWYFYDNFVLKLNLDPSTKLPLIFDGKTELFYTTNDAEKTVLDINQDKFSDTSGLGIAKNKFKHTPFFAFYVKKSIWEGFSGVIPDQRWRIPDENFLSDLNRFNRTYFTPELKQKIEDNRENAEIVGLITPIYKEVASSITLIENEYNALWITQDLLNNELRRRAFAYALFKFQENPKATFDLMKAMQIARIPRQPSKDISDMIRNSGLEDTFASGVRPFKTEEEKAIFISAIQNIPSKDDTVEFMRIARIIQHARRK